MINHCAKFSGARHDADAAGTSEQRCDLYLMVVYSLAELFTSRHDDGYVARLLSAEDGADASWQITVLARRMCASISAKLSHGVASAMYFGGWAGPY